MTAGHVDVLIVGAGLSGVGAAYRLKTQTPGKTYTLLEARDVIGGTWDLFRYPGVRSDSDMFTLSYPFHPWTGPDSIADGPSILAYIRETAAAYGIDRHIRFGHRVVRASWSSPDSRWTVKAESGPDRRPVTYTCSFLYICSGYYSYAGGHVVDFPGQDRFQGRIVHPQQWPDDLDHRDRTIVVIGSGATAVTLLPALAKRAAHVTMLQRSPGYIVSMPRRDAVADRLRAMLPEKAAYRVVRGKNVVLSTLMYHLCRRWPERMAKVMRAGVARRLPGTVPLDPHFVPRYKPWDQRVCLVPDADLFDALSDGRAGVVTGEIDTFTEDGVRLRSGEELRADIIVTATGLEMVAFGQISLVVDGAAVDPGRMLVYKGMMFSGVPNLAWCVGYTNASWTLRSDLISRYVCRLLDHMDRHGYAKCLPYADPADPSLVSSRPIVDLTSGYVRRAAGIMPKQGARRPWFLRQNYLRDLVVTRLGRVDDEAMRFSRAGGDDARHVAARSRASGSTPPSGA
jgi:monooxygenase